MKPDFVSKMGAVTTCMHLFSEENGNFEFLIFLNFLNLSNPDILYTILKPFSRAIFFLPKIFQKSQTSSNPKAKTENFQIFFKL